MNNQQKYCAFFDVDEKYSPCVDESAIRGGEKWENTYPHETFIKLLNSVERMLGGGTNRSIWIHGAYGTGKSKCAYAIKRMLEVPENELRSYWEHYQQLKKNPILLEKLIGYKNRGIITAYRYASGSITTPQQLFFAVQESIKKSLLEQGVEYLGQNTLKESVIAWMDGPAQKNFIDELLKKPEWYSTFSQDNADQIINALKKDGDVSDLIDNIFKMAAKEGITALNLDADSLRNWILDIINTTHKQIVLIWDEFSDFFRINKNSLGEFQKIVSICEEAPFYFIVVTHPISSITTNDDSWKIVQQRFEQCEITLPDNIAFELIGDAFNVKDAAKSTWEQCISGLDSEISSSKNAVMKAANITDKNIMKDIIPIHPMAALVLKNIASGFQSNQRSMFDFIKTTGDTDVKAFQWFIQNYGPMDEHPLLTIDMLWDFFYEKGKGYLTSDIKLILDTFAQQTLLNDKEKVVLKTILIMQAIDQRLGGQHPILKPTDQNLSYAFEGIIDLQFECKNIAKALVDKGVLILTPIGDGKKVYSAAVLAGDGAKIENHKTDIRKSSSTYKLVSDAPALASSLSLSPALKLRYATDINTGALPVVTISDYIKTMESLSHKDIGWHFYAVLALAKDEEEAQAFRTLIKKNINNENYKNIVIIDALSTPLTQEAFEQFVDYSAMSMYYQGNNNQQAKDNSRKARDILEREWKNRIADGQFVVYTYNNQDGEKVKGANAVQSELQAIVLNKFPYVPDFSRQLTESQLKLTQGKVVAKCGIEKEVRGLINGCERNVLGAVWNQDNYWENPDLQNNNIVIIKKALDKIINKKFDNGKVSIDDIYDYLEITFGFSPCNVSAFVTGFLLKEYGNDPYRYGDSEGHNEGMTPDKLSEMIGNYIGKKTSKSTYIVKMTPEEKAFYETTEKAWGITPNSCSSPSQAGSQILNKIRELGYPIWCLEEVDTDGVYEIIKMYTNLLQKDGNQLHDIAIEIGKISLQRPYIGENLSKLITQENCQKGMMIFIKQFKEGKLYSLANDIKATDRLLSDAKDLFSIKYSALWENSTGEDEINKLLNEYEFIKTSNSLLNISNNNLVDTITSWKESLRFIGFSGESAASNRPELKNIFEFLFKVANENDILSDYIKDVNVEFSEYISDIRDIINNPTDLFSKIYKPYLNDFTIEEIDEIRNLICTDTNMFLLRSTMSNEKVKNAAEEYKRNQIKTQLFDLWRKKTATKDPRDWSNRNRTPILCCVSVNEYGDAKKSFEVLNNPLQRESDIKDALAFLERATFITNLNDKVFIDKCFIDKMLGEYAAILTDLDKLKDILESLPVDTYDWIDSPMVKNSIKEIAESEYFAGMSDKAVSAIDNMSNEELKLKLKELVQKDVTLGIKIMNGGK